VPSSSMILAPARTALLASLACACWCALSLLGAAPAQAAEAGTVWLCKPGLVNDPCLSSEEATVELGNGSSFVQPAQPARNPPIDCFYVYPTVSSQPTTNANLEIDPEESQIAVNQASRFSQVCKVYAPVYPQITVLALVRAELGHNEVTPETLQIAYAAVLEAWKEYLAKYNHGRGVVLIGHSQGAGMLIRLLREQIDPVPSERHLLVSALLMGGNVLVPAGQLVGGSFKHVPGCKFAWETQCVVAYSSFLEEPPAGAFFARPGSAVTALSGVNPSEISNPEVLCVNPTQLVQDEDAAGPLLPYYSTTPFPGLLSHAIQAPAAPTPWVSTPGQYSAQCRRGGGANWLQVNDVGPPEDPREMVEETLGPLWGTHLDDINLALGNLVGTVWLQSLAYELGGHGL
jgi:Protein of unknown function (DUF3089)